jgi:hypothetical protein
MDDSEKCLVEHNSLLVVNVQPDRVSEVYRYYPVTPTLLGPDKKGGKNDLRS